MKLLDRLPDGPLGAFLELRMRLALRRFRGRGGVPELVARVLSYVMVAPAAVVLASLVGIGTYQAARAGRGRLVDVSVAAILFGIWQAWTAVGLSIQEREGLDLARFLHYPLPAVRIFGYGVAASVVGDPFAIFWCVMLGGAWAGAAAARPGLWLLPLAGLLALFMVATAVNVFLIQEVMARLLRRKWVKVAGMGLLYGGLIFGWSFLAGMRRSDPRVAALLAGVRTLRWLLWPPALAEAAATPLFEGRPMDALLPAAGLLVALLVAGWLAFLLNLSGARAGGPVAGAGGSARGAGWPLDRLPGRRARALAPLLERELKQLLRHPLAGVLLLVIPAMATMVVWYVLPRMEGEGSDVLRALPLLAFALYTHLATQAFWLNAFGWDRGGVRAHLLAPRPLGQVLAAKNLATYLLAAALLLGCLAVVTALAGPPPGWVLAATLALHLGAAPWLHGLGNAVSILNPRAASLTLQRSGNLSALSSLGGMVILSGVAGLFALPVLLALKLDEPWVLPAAWAALGLLGLAAYRVALPRVAGLLASRRELVIGAVAGEEG